MYVLEVHVHLFHYIYHHVQSCSVRSSWEGRYTPLYFVSIPLFSLYTPIYSVLYTEYSFRLWLSFEWQADSQTPILLQYLIVPARLFPAFFILNKIGWFSYWTVQFFICAALLFSQTFWFTYSLFYISPFYTFHYAHQYSMNYCLLILASGLNVAT